MEPERVLCKSAKWLVVDGERILARTRTQPVRLQSKTNSPAERAKFINLHRQTNLGSC